MSGFPSDLGGCHIALSNSQSVSALVQQNEPGLFITNVVPMSSRSANVGFLSDRKWKGLSAACG